MCFINRLPINLMPYLNLKSRGHQHRECDILPSLTHTTSSKSRFADVLLLKDQTILATRTGVFYIDGRSADRRPTKTLNPGLRVIRA